MAALLSLSHSKPLASACDDRVTPPANVCPIRNTSQRPAGASHFSCPCESIRSVMS